MILGKLGFRSSDDLYANNLVVPREFHSKFLSHEPSSDQYWALQAFPEVGRVCVPFIRSSALFIFFREVC